MDITKDTNVEELSRNFPASVSIFAKYRIRLMQAGSVRWGSIEQIAKQKNYSDEEISAIVKELKEKYELRKRN